MYVPPVPLECAQILTVRAALGFIGALGLVAWSLPWMLFGYLPVLIIIMSLSVLISARPLELTVYYFLLSYSQSANRDIKRLDSLARSFIFAGVMEQVCGVIEHVSAPQGADAEMNGLNVIRALHQTARFERDVQSAVDNQNVSRVRISLISVEDADLCRG